jgi:nucleoid-associated protein YgaU
VLKPGDTLGHLSQRYYGSARHWDRIADANPAVDIERLRVGQELKIPAGSTRQASTSTPSRQARPIEGKRHVIDEGETLSSIAEDRLGNTSHWYRIYEANRERIGSDPDRLVVGMVIAIPG